MNNVFYVGFLSIAIASTIAGCKNTGATNTAPPSTPKKASVLQEKSNGNQTLGTTITQTTTTTTSTSSTTSTTTTTLPVSHFSLTGSMIEARSYHTATLLDSGDVLVVGGRGDSGISYFLNSAEIYSFRNKTFQATTGPMSLRRAHHTATKIDGGRVLIAGGLSDSGVSKAVEIYDPTTKSFSPATELLVARANHHAVKLSDGRIFFAGGSIFISNTCNAEIYDPRNGARMLTSAMKTCGNVQMVLALPRDANVGDPEQILVAHTTFGFSPTTKVEIYNVNTNTFTERYYLMQEAWGGFTGSFGSNNTVAPGRSAFRGIVLPNQRVLVTGGSTNNSTYSNSILLEPRQGAFQAHSAMAVNRTQHKMLTLKDGNILIIGGTQSSVPIGGLFYPFKNSTPPIQLSTKVEKYNPTTQAFSSLGDLNTARFESTATLLNDGKVLITGGITGALDNLKSAELYDPTGSTTSSGGSGSGGSGSSGGSSPSTRTAELRFYGYCFGKGNGCYGGHEVLLDLQTVREIVSIEFEAMDNLGATANGCLKIKVESTFLPAESYVDATTDATTCGADSIDVPSNFQLEKISTSNLSGRYIRIIESRDEVYIRNIVVKFRAP